MCFTVFEAFTCYPRISAQQKEKKQKNYNDDAYSCIIFVVLNTAAATLHAHAHCTYHSGNICILHLPMTGQSLTVNTSIFSSILLYIFKCILNCPLKNDGKLTPHTLFLSEAALTDISV